MHDYHPISNNEERLERVVFNETSFSPSPKPPTHIKCNIFLIVTGFILGAVTGSAFEALYARNNTSLPTNNSDVALSIDLPTILRDFVYSSPFSQEPPQGEWSGNESEPIWDILIPNGLGYFKDDRFAPETSIPTVFHQLHCLYFLRRAYYSKSEDLQEFDFGKERVPHAAHCFDYIQQGLTCSVDSTIEPAKDEEHGFLGSGFPRKCRDFEALKTFVQERRVFNATGFMAAGLHHGHVNVDTP